MPADTDSPFAWWEARRRRYNVGLVVAGLFAFLAYATIGATLVPEEADFEISLFTVAFWGIVYLLLIAVANVCYFLGPVSEWCVRPSDPARYRRVCYALGFGFSVLLPFSMPVMLAITALVHPGAWKPSP